MTEESETKEKSQLKSYHNYSDNKRSDDNALDVIEELPDEESIAARVVSSDLNQSVIGKQTENDCIQLSAVSQNNVNHKNSEQLSADSSPNNRSTIMNGSYDQNGVKRVSKAYKMKRDSIRMLLESPNIDLGNAIECHNVSFGYNKKSQVLSNISINVPKGKIYVLIGSSGCGKTTLLRLVLGRMKNKRGKISVFGQEPGAHTSHIPGPGVGYMPQELALFPEFTIKETLQYFGCLYHLNPDVIDHRIDFLIKLLNLPHRNKKISKLSGGQQRRASIAVALFHAPPLLILDEPMVGVDPLLRCRLWEYLESLCVNESITVLITTHYVEESRDAQTIGFLRFGRICVQTNPTTLLSRYKCVTLEEVFLKLCKEDCDELNRDDESLVSIHLSNPANRKKSMYANSQHMDSTIWVEPEYKQKPIDIQRLKALFHKNYLKLKGNPLLVFFFLILPVIQITLLCESVVKDPDSLPVAIYSPETFGNLSAMFLNNLDTTMIKTTSHDSLKSAINAVERGKAWYAISMSENFSEAFYTRSTYPQDLTDEDVEDSKIKLYTDKSDSFIQQFLDESIYQSYHRFLQKVVASVGLNPVSVSQPIDVQPFVYGKIEKSLINTIIPGSIVAIIYSTPLLLAAFLIVLERKDGLLERSFVAGVRSFEILLAHMCTMMLALVIQVALLMFVAFALFEAKLEGSPYEVFSLIYLQGMIGIILGLFVSAISPHETAALLLAFGFVFPMWMVCGVFWPLESVPGLLKSVFYAAPLSLPIESMRYIISRGWNVSYMEVQIGFAVSGAYSLILFIATAVIFHMNSNY